MATPYEISLDFETSSRADLKRVGTARYARDPSTRVLCYSIKDHHVGIMSHDVVTPELDDYHLTTPRWAFDAAKGKCLIHAYNAAFEWWMLNEVCTRMGWPAIPASAMRCTLARARYWGYSGTLDETSRVFGGPPKNMAGHKLMMKVSKPRRATTKRAESWWYEDEPQLLDDLVDYCDDDVEAEHYIASKLPPLPSFEQRVFELDLRMNAAGLRVDTDLVEELRQATIREKERQDARIERATGGAVTKTTQVARLTSWAGDRLGEAVESLDKEALAELLGRAKDAKDQELWDALDARRIASKSSTAKLGKIQEALGPGDDRVRGLLQYYGAARTGRWAGRIVQPQNLPRGVVKGPIGSADQIVMGLSSVEDVARDSGTDVMTVASGLIRTCLVPDEAEDGGVFLAPDYGQIEARVIAWLAGQDDILVIFARGDDVYVYTAKNIGSDNRQLGKVCLSGDTLVLVKDSANNVIAKPIRDVTTEHRVWDGETWVCHEGLIFQGIKPAVELDGVRLTPEHKISCGKTWVEAGQAAQDDAILSRALASGSESLRSLVSWSESGAGCSGSWSDALVAHLNTALTPTASPSGAARAATSAPLAALTKPSGKNTSTTGMRCRIRNTALACSTALQQFTHGARTQTASLTRTMGVEAYGSGVAGVLPTPGARLAAPDAALSSNTWSALMAGISPTWSWIGSTTTEATNPETCASSPAGSTTETGGRRATFKVKSTASALRLPVYDLANAGPNRRFTVLTDSGALVVSNCVLGLGFGMGAGAFIDAARVMGGLELDERFAADTVSAWRDANSEIVAFWYELEDAAWRVLTQRGPLGWIPVGAGRVHVGRARNKIDGKSIDMNIRLPSGRVLVYPRLRRTKHPSHGRESLCYDGLNPVTGKFSNVFTYSGKLAENVTQAVARDVMALALVRLDDWGRLGVPRLTVHDEAILNVPASKDLARVQRAVEEVMLFEDGMGKPRWLDGLPLKVEADVKRRYAK